MWEEAALDAKTKQKIRELKREYPQDFGRDQRRLYLMQHYQKAFLAVYKRSRRYVEDVVFDALILTDAVKWADRPESKACLANILSDRIKELVKFQNKCFYKRHPLQKGRITPERVEEAKAYPFGNLLIIARGKAICPFHADKDPSMQFYRHDNHVHCFSCNKSWDTISFVMEKEGISFVQAVDRLTT